jgi:hypothetical protein
MCMSTARFHAPFDGFNPERPLVGSVPVGGTVGSRRTQTGLLPFPNMSPSLHTGALRLPSSR